MKKYIFYDLDGGDFMKDCIMTEKEIINHFRKIVIDGESDINYEKEKDFVNSSDFNLDFIADFWKLEIKELKKEIMEVIKNYELPIEEKTVERIANDAETLCRDSGYELRSCIDKAINDYYLIEED